MRARIAGFLYLVAACDPGGPGPGACRGAEPPLRYRPQRRVLALLNTGDGRAIFSYGSFAMSGRWAMALKDRIDRGFMRRFKRLEGSEK